METTTLNPPLRRPIGYPSAAPVKTWMFFVENRGMSDRTRRRDEATGIGTV